MNDNQVKATLPPLYSRLLNAKAEYTGQSKSEIVADAIKEKFDKMPMAEREHILNITKK